jgi:hypothetical protein
MDNQHRKIVGYRELSEGELALMNRIKKQGSSLQTMVQDLKDNPALDQRWVEIGATDLQTGLMALVRAVAQPDGF